MKLKFKEKLFVTMGIIALVSFAISWLLYRMQMGIYHSSESYMADSSIIRVNRPDEDFYIREHGQYWILYNYIKAAKEFKGNESVTLVLHGNWSDIGYLPEIVTRWWGPVTLTIFACGDEYAWSIAFFVYYLQCTIYGPDIRAFVNINFILNDRCLPEHIVHKYLEHYMVPTNCSNYFNPENNERDKFNLTFPSNLARNVGRITARTHFVLLLDMENLPSSGIPELFLEMINANDFDTDVRHPQRTVYVLPSIDIPFGTDLPRIESDFERQDKKFLDLYLKSTSVHKIPRLREWLETKNKPKTSIFDRTKRRGQWLAYYITANGNEPLYDENSDKEIDRSEHMDLLEALDYNFYIVNFGFVLRRLEPPYNFTIKTPLLENDTQAYSKKLMKIQILKDFYLNFM